MPVVIDQDANGRNVYYYPPKKPRSAPVIHSTPPAVHYTPSSGGRGGGGKGGAYDLSAFTAGAIAEAEQEVTDFAGWLGWPKWFDYNAMVKRVLQIGYQADTTQAYEFLWTQLSKDRQASNMNAYFGLTQQQYREKQNNLSDMYEMYTGNTAVPDDLRNRALRENWTQSELMTHLQADPTVGATAPWLAAGMTFRDVTSQFTQTYGAAPKSKDVLSSWWKFRTGAQQVGSGQVAQETFAPPPPRTSSDSEVR